MTAMQFNVGPAKKTGVSLLHHQVYKRLASDHSVISRSSTNCASNKWRTTVPIHYPNHMLAILALRVAFALGIGFGYEVGSVGHLIIVVQVSRAGTLLI